MKKVNDPGQLNEDEQETLLKLMAQRDKPASEEDIAPYVDPLEVASIAASGGLSGLRGAVIGAAENKAKRSVFDRLKNRFNKDHPMMATPEELPKNSRSDLISLKDNQNQAFDKISGPGGSIRTDGTTANLNKDRFTRTTDQFSRQMDRDKAAGEALASMRAAKRAKMSGGRSFSDEDLPSGLPGAIDSLALKPALDPLRANVATADKVSSDYADSALSDEDKEQLRQLIAARRGQ